jgi:ribosomal protein S18 acetylase RimI-like enzyme
VLSAAIVLEEVGPDQWQVWRALRLAALAEAPYAYGSTLAEWRHAPEERWRARLGGVAQNLVASVEGARCGMASGVAGSPCELIGMWVAPSARGRGVGDALVRAVLAFASRRGEPVELEVLETNARAIALYRRHGFVTVGTKGDELVLRAAPGHLPPGEGAR